PSLDVPVVKKAVWSGLLSMCPTHQYTDPAPTFGQSRNGTDYRLPTPRLTGISPSAYPERPPSLHRCHGCPALALQQA
nr:hypothetical protein [Tanacetum cinerariifolium]